MKKLAIALSKGEVGKTTTAVNLAAGLAKKGKSVLLVDVDTQGQAARALGVHPEVGLAEVIGGEAEVETACTAARENLWVLSGGRTLAGLKRVITRKDFGGEQTLVETMHGMDERFDYVILVTAPGWDALTVNVLFYADAALAPVWLEVMTNVPNRGIGQRTIAEFTTWANEKGLSYYDALKPISKGEETTPFASRSSHAGQFFKHAR